MTFQHILAVVDDTDAGARALRAGAVVAAAGAAEFTALRMIDDPWPFIGQGEVEAKRGLRDNAWHATATARASDDIRRLVAGVTPRIRFGPVAVEVERATEHGHTDLIVLGAPLPGVIDDILLRTRVPCLIVPPDWQGCGRVVVWGDVYREAFAFAALFRSDVVVVDAEPQFAYAGADGAESEARKAFAVWAKLPGTGTFDLVVRHGDPATQALAVARSERADVLVIGYAPGAGASVAAAVAQRAPCAVLLVPV